MLVCMLMFVMNLSAKDYAIISKETRVFESASSKSYPITNRADDDIVLKPGMAFEIVETSPGWLKVEYTPGLKGYILQQSTAKSAGSSTSIKAGKYTIANQPGATLEIKVTPSLQAISSGKTYEGETADNVLIFKDEFGNPAFTAVRLDGEVVVFSYDPKLTKLL